MSDTNEMCRTILGKARLILSDKNQWTKGLYVTPITGTARASLREGEQYAYCAVGALREARNRLLAGSPSEVVNAAYKQALWRLANTRRAQAQQPTTGSPSEEADLARVTGWNDSSVTRHNHVLAVYDKALDETLS